ncbi:polysaccharide deacetylase [Chitinispirillum alkaliphilum]|nr:polysaccharide deacetylase [Chitinispirillum alkaliphilum]
MFNKYCTLLLVFVILFFRYANSSDYAFPSHMPPGGKSPSEVNQYIVFNFDDNAYSGLSGTQFEPDPRVAEANWQNSGFVGQQASACGLSIEAGEMGLSWALSTLAGGQADPGYPTFDADTEYPPGTIVGFQGTLYQSNRWVHGSEGNPQVNTSGWENRGPASTGGGSRSRTNPDGSNIRFTFSMLSGLFVDTWGAEWTSRESKFGYFVPSSHESRDHDRIAVSWGREMGIGSSQGSYDIQPNQLVAVVKQAIEAGHEIADHTIDHMESNSPLPGDNPLHNNTWNQEMGFGRWGNEGFNATDENVTPWGTFRESESFGQPVGHTAQTRGWTMYAGRFISQNAWEGLLRLSLEQYDTYLSGTSGYTRPVGFRAPRLEGNSAMLFALKAQGYLYDCSVEAGYEPNMDGTNAPWPFTTDNGIPNKAYQISAGWGKTHDHERGHHGHPYDSAPAGLWQLPVQVMVVPENLRDQVWVNHARIRSASPDGQFRNTQDSLDTYNSFIDDGKIIGFDFNMLILWGMTAHTWLETMKHNLELRMNNNKAPLLYGANTDYYTPIYDHATLLEDFNRSSYGLVVTEGWNTWVDRRDAMEGFVDWAVAQGAYFVDGVTLIEKIREMQQNEVFGEESDLLSEWNFQTDDLESGSSVASFTGVLDNATVTVSERSGEKIPNPSYITTFPAGELSKLTHISLNYKTSAPLSLRLVRSNGDAWEVILANMVDRFVESGRIPINAFKPDWYAEHNDPLDPGEINSIQIKLITDSNVSQIHSLSLAEIKLYGAEITIEEPVLEIADPVITDEKQTSARVSANLLQLGTTNPLSHGFAWSTEQYPTISNDTIDIGTVSETGIFSSVLTDLTPGTLYYVRAYAIDSKGTTYSSQVSFTTVKEDQNITFGTLQSVVYGEPSFELTASSTSGLPLTFTSSNSSVASVDGVRVTIHNAGSTMITASQEGNSNFNPAESIARELLVKKRAISVTADFQTKVYGDEDPELSFVITDGSLVGEDALSGSLSWDEGESVGEYKIHQNTLGAGSNYNLTFTEGVLEVVPRDLTIEADFQTKVYGDEDPELSFVITDGSLVGEDALSGSLSRDEGESVGEYKISQNTLGAGSNYNLTFTEGVLEIVPRDLTIEADFQTKVYGDEDPELSFVITDGSLVGEDALSGSLFREEGESVGEYKISQNTLTGGLNYNIEYRENVLRVIPKQLIITACDKSKVQGETDPDFTVTYKGFVFDDDSTAVSNLRIIREEGELPGIYQIVPFRATAPNYVISFVNGTLTIELQTFIFNRTPRNRSGNSENGIRIVSNPVRRYENQAEFRVVTDGNADIKISVYDNNGNLINQQGWVGQPRNSQNPFVWDLRTIQGTRVSTGSYLIVAQVRSQATGRIEIYRAILGVQR